MNFKTEIVLPGAVGFDTSANLLTGYAISNYHWSMLQQLYLAAQRPGYRPFMIRYLGLSSTSVGPSDLTLPETQLITTIGFGLMTVQERFSGWSAQTGAADGDAAAINAQTCGILNPVCLFSAAEIYDKQACIAYEGAWWDALLKRNPALEPSAGCYVGSPVLTEQEWEDDINVHRYWAAAGQVPPVAQRGYQLRQIWPGNFVVAGIPVDWNAAFQDYKGDTPIAQVAA